ncbi:S41 family peptidase [Lacinutrix iliipiscaria]|uniref:S41 family peptidase n=1 Tax=Lacinutrix iliipiscaria TaxID=1230532 RepID=A0ABW5WMK1_9FLAO
MKRIILILGFVLSSNTLLTQNPKCDCAIVYDNLIEKLEDNYIGLAQLRILNKDKEYEKRKIEYKNKVSKINSANCAKYLQQFLSFFEDGHLFTFELPKYSENETKQFREKIKEDVISTNSILNTLEYEKKMIEKNGLDGIIGQWTDGKSKFAIIKDEGYYKAYIISSTIETVEPGELKAIYKSTDNGFEGTYYSYGYSPRYVEGNIYKEGTLLVFTGANYWGKIGDNSVREISMIHNEDTRLPVIQKLDNTNTLFSIPSFMADYQKFNQIILDNLELLKNTTNLIIDIRGNVGGNAIYFSFLDAYATQSMQSTQGLVLASEQTKIYFERFTKNSHEIYNPVVERIKTNIGQIINGPKYPIREFEPFESNIKNVAILTDNGCMSAAESFIIHSKKASTKVKTFGKPTDGVIDYTSVNSIKLNSGDQNIYFGYPTSTLNKDVFEEGYNKTGIIPDVPIKDNVKDKIQFIIDYYKNK